VTYVRDIGEEQSLSDVFITELEREGAVDLDKTIVMVAEEGETKVDEQGNRLLILRDGKRYRLRTSELDHQVIEFETYGQVLARDPSKLDRVEAKQRGTLQLLSLDSRAGIAELEWRISLVLMVPVLVFLAIPLARVEPREGRFARIAPALLLCFLYLVLLSAAKSRIETGDLAPFPGLFWIHAAYLVLSGFIYRGSDQLFRFDWLKRMPAK
jgi:lipopolysaccharide export system permease protein